LSMLIRKQDAIIEESVVTPWASLWDKLHPVWSNGENIGHF